MTAEEGLRILEDKTTITEAGMTRLQKQMSVKQARRFRRLIRDEAKKWRTMGERCLTRSLREKGIRSSPAAKGTPLEGRQKYTLIDGAMGIPLNSRGTVLPLVHRYPNGGIYLDLRLWARKDDDSKTTLTPTRKGLALPMREIHQLIGSLQVLYANWKRNNPDQVQEIPQPSAEFRKLQRKISRFFQKAGSS